MNWAHLRWLMRMFTAVFVIHMLWTGRWITVLALTVVGMSIGVGVAIIQERRQEGMHCDERMEP